MGLFLTGLGLLLCCSLSSPQRLAPSERNVCQDLRDPSTLVCCTGWRQQGEECTIPVCDGERACQQDEVCVYPGVCRCRPGYYGAHCKTRCPPEFWAPDCREMCKCHPHGRCDPITGECTCLPNRWGPLCQNACRCGRHGHCHPVHGNCTCDEGWWTPTCTKQCQCYPGTSTCDPLTGRCQCASGFWGQKCSLRCSCYISSCQQKTGACECQNDWWGPSCDRHCNCDLKHSECHAVSGECLCQPGYKGAVCNEPCGPGEYGSGCTLSCGHCKRGQPCSVVDGVCKACEPGWNGTRCDRPCKRGYHGNDCHEACPRCRNGEPCNPRTGACSRCDPGWTGPRCDKPCFNRTFGDACRFLCSPCFHGHCDHVTGSCVCGPGFQGQSCNITCPDQLYGFNCSSVCDCGEGTACHPETGACPFSGHRALIAGLLVPLTLVLLGLVCCCCCCGGPTDGKDRVAVGDGGTSVRMKYHVYNVLANVSSAVPCISIWSSGLPRVTVSHHDPELTFNHSFIEPPSSGWVTDGSSFDSDEETGEALYCVPPREDIPAVAGGEFQEFQHEMSSKCNMFPDPSAFSVSAEDMSLPFGIPRTSSNAKSKRPSVSFAEGTRFSPKERRGSAQDLTPGAPRTKPKSPWGVLMLSALQAHGGKASEGEERETGEGGVDGCGGETGPLEEPGSSGEAGDPDVDRYTATPSQAMSTLQVPGALVGRRRTISNTAVNRKGGQTPGSTSNGQQAEIDKGMDKVTTVYVTVGKAGVGRPLSKLELPSSEGPVQAMLRRLGSLQRHKDQEGGTRSKGKIPVAEGITKPPRRKLGARASVWEQGGHPPLGVEGPVGEGVPMRKPSRRKQHAHHSSPAVMGNTDDGTNTHPPPEGANATIMPTRPLSSILKSVPEVAGLEVMGERSAVRGGNGDPGMQTETDSGYLTVGPAGVVTNAVSLSEVIANDGVVASVDDGANLYENVMIMHS
ncbi:scavenger receptor class F member 1 isoform X1 [Oncorhynchus kisutch]|uniref:scavenger receptor class F member 1 isoform X1 n=2 Tax=Oncorhynchus kisutch TaxID=8019 RepID=UPI00099F9993|nr:scavenger receptor class F member 1 isoform X1 [Oncorhynchus kisutch]